MCLGQVDLEVNRETASEMASLPWSQNNRKENAARTKVSTSGPGISWSYFMSRHNSRWLLDLSPKQSNKWARALSWVPGFHSFLKWAIQGRNKTRNLTVTHKPSLNCNPTTLRDSSVLKDSLRLVPASILRDQQTVMQSRQTQLNWKLFFIYTFLLRQVFAFMMTMSGLPMPDEHLPCPMNSIKLIYTQTVGDLGTRLRKLRALKLLRRELSSVV